MNDSKFMTYSMETLAGNIRKRREEAGLTRREFARESGVAESSIYNIEKRLTQPRIDTIWIIARHLGVSLDELCGG